MGKGNEVKVKAFFPPI